MKLTLAQITQLSTVIQRAEKELSNIAQLPIKIQICDNACVQALEEKKEADVFEQDIIKAVIFDAIEEVLSVKIEALKSKERFTELVFARFCAYYFLHKTAYMNISAIGRCLKRDHTTVIYGLRRVDAIINNRTFPDENRQFRTIKSIIESNLQSKKIIK